MQILRPNDLVSLCLVCRELSSLVMPVLYKHLDLSAEPDGSDPANLEKYTSLYSSRGLQYVRSLRMDCSLHTSGNSGLLLEKLLPMLRPHSLTNFEVNYFGSLTLRNLKILWSTQKSLMNIQLDVGYRSPKSPSIDDLLRELVGDLRSLENVRNLRLRLGASADLGSCAGLLMLLDYSKLEQISLELERPWLKEEEVYEVRTLNHDLFPRYIPSNIQNLCLDSIWLPEATTVQLDTWPCLTALSVLSCRNVRPMLASFNTPKLVSFIYQDEAKDEHNCTEEERLLSVASMIGRFNTLQTLILDTVWVQRGASAVHGVITSLRNHSRTLRSLAFSSVPEGAEPEDAVNDSLIVFLSTCTRLQELTLYLRLDRIVQTSQVSRFDLVSLLLAVYFCHI